MTDLTLARQCLGFGRTSQKPKHSIPRGTFARIALRFDCTRANVSRVMAGHYKSLRIATAICEASGLRAADLWPGQYPRLEKLQAMQAAQAAKPAH